MMPYLRAANVTWLGIDLTDVKEMDFTPAEVETYRLKSGDILLAEASGSPSEVGKPALYVEGAQTHCFQNTLIRVRANRALSRFLHLHFLGDVLLGHFAKAARGVGIQHLGAEALSGWEVALPPLSEQQRIVDVVDSYLTRIDDAVASLARVHAKLKAYRASVLKAAVEGRLVPTEASLTRAEKRAYETAEVLRTRILKERRRRWEEAELAKLKAKGNAPQDERWKAKYQEPTAPDTSTLPELPEGWCWASLGLMKEFSLYGPRFSSDDYAEDGVLVLRTSDISEAGRVDLATPPRLNLAREDFERYQAKRGDLLITRTGSLGTLAVLDDDVRAIAGAYLIQYRLAAPTETTWYSFYFLKSPRAQMQLVQGGQGVGRPNLNVPTIDSILIPLPPLAEQARIIDEIQRLTSVSDELAVQMNADIQRGARLRQAVLKWAFQGKLVDQDPNDEPAERLLAHIRAERAVVAPTKKSRGRTAKGVA